jgi:tRNA uridine 5-carboxymethylaminomethyl modification enzyme
MGECIFRQFEQKWKKIEEFTLSSHLYHLKKDELENIGVLQGNDKIRLGDSYEKLFAKGLLPKEAKTMDFFSGLSEDELFGVFVNCKYSGYLSQQQDQIQKFRKTENLKIPDDLDYQEIGSLTKEALEKFKKFKPSNIGQASRISGITPSDIWNIIVYLERKKLNLGKK